MSVDFSHTPLSRIVSGLSGGDVELIYGKITNGDFDSLIPGASKMAACSQGTIRHLEGDVAKHTAIVISNIRKFSSDDPLCDVDEIDLLAGLVHDIEKTSTAVVEPDGHISFPGHEERAAKRVPEIAEKLKLNSLQQDKLLFLVAEHGTAHGLPNLSNIELKRLVTSPFWRNLRLLQKADAHACYLNRDGSEHLRVYWREFEEFHDKMTSNF